MYPEICPQHSHSYFSNEDEFLNPLMNVNAFLVEDTLVGMHAQEFTEINIVLAGSGVHYIKNRCIPAKAGDVFFILPDYTHGYMGDQDFKVYNITIHKRFFAKHLTDLQSLPAFSVLFQSEPLLRTSNASPMHLILNGTQLDSLRFLLKEIHQYSQANAYSEALICNSLVVTLICRLCIYYVENVGKFNTKKKKRDDAFLSVLTLIHEQYQDNITVDNLAEMAYLSRSALVRKFHEVCGMSPHKYLMKRRIEAATHYLENTDLPLAEIAENVGFYDTAHFTRVFKASTGVSPINYRKNIHIYKDSSK